MQQALDGKGRIYYIDENGNKVQPQGALNPFQKFGRNLIAKTTNLGSFLNESNPDSDMYKQKTNIGLALATLPIGGGVLGANIGKALVPFLGKKIGQMVGESAGAGLLSGGLEGFGRGLIEQKNPIKTAVQDGTIGLVTGSLGGLGVGKIGKQLAKRNLYGDEVAQTNYFNDYIEGLNNNTPVGVPSRFNKEWQKFNELRAGDKLVKESMPDLIADNEGYPVSLYHGTSEIFDQFDKDKLGMLTGAESAKKGFWFTDSKNTAQSYANYSAENSGINKLLKQQRVAEVTRNWDEYDRLTEEIENYALNETKPTPRIVEAYLDMNTPAQYDAKGKRFMEIQYDINDFLKNNPSADGFIINNLRDAVDNNLEEVATHYMVREPNQIKILPDNVNPLRKKQFEIIQKYNPMNDEYHTGIRSINDIKEPQDVFNVNTFGGTPDFKFSDAVKALKDDLITVYSSKPIEAGGFITPSKMDARSYAGFNSPIYEARIPLNDYAPIDDTQGQYAPTEHLKYNLNKPLKYRKNNIIIDNRNVPELFFEPDEYAPLSSAFTTFAMQNKIKNTGLTKPHFDYYFDTYIDKDSMPHFLRIKQ